MATLPRPSSPEQARILELIHQGFLVLNPADRSLPVTYKGLTVLMAEAEPQQTPPPRRVRIGGD